MRHPLQRVLLWSLLLLWSSACGRSEVSRSAPAEWAPEEERPSWTMTPDSEWISLEIAPAELTLPIGARRPLAVTALGKNGERQDVSQETEWSSSAPEVAAAMNGAVTSIAPGVATVTATWSGLTRELPVSVLDARVTSITVSPERPILRPDARVSLRAEGTYDDGTVADVTELATWSSLTEEVARVSNEPGSIGVVTGAEVGTSLILAAMGDVDGSVRVRVTDEAELVDLLISPPSAELLLETSRRFRVWGLYSDGARVDVSAQVDWSASPEGVAYVDLDGVVRARAPGQAMVTARLDTFEVSAPVFVSDARVQDLRISPPSATVGPGAQVAFVADATLTDGTRRDVTELVAWSTSDAVAANIDASGVAITARPGRVDIDASIQGVTARALLTIKDTTLVRLGVEPPEPTLGAGTTQRFRALGVFDDGSVAEVTRAADWATSNAEVSTMLEGARLRTRAPGDTVVTATLEGLTGQASVTITDASLVSLEIAPGDLLLSQGQAGWLRVQGVWADGTRQDLTETATWTSSRPEQVTVDTAAPNAGRVFAVSGGGATITATFQNVSADAIVSVTDQVPQELRLEPDTLTMPAGTQTQVRAIAVYDDETERDVTEQVSWTSPSPGLVEVRNDPGNQGRVFARNPGQVTIEGQLGRLRAPLPVTVTAATLQSIAIEPSDALLPLGEERQFSAMGTFSDGSTFDVTRDATWSTGNAIIAGVRNELAMRGVVYGRSPGNTEVSARVGAVRGQTQVEITGPELVALRVRPETSVTPIGEERQFTARALYADGRTRNVSGEARWVSADPGVATVNTEGLARGVAPGTTTLTASWAGLTGSAPMEVTETSLVEVQVTPQSPSVARRSYIRFFATAIYSDGTRKDVTEGVDWFTDDPDVMTVTINEWWPGIGTAQGPGNAIISARYRGLTGTTTVNVTDADLVEVRVAPINLTVAPGTELQFLATALYSDGTSRDVTFLSKWTTDQRDIVDVRNEWRQRGKATARREGTVEVRATYQEVTGTATMTVTAATLTQVQVIPFSPTVNEGDQLRFFATALYSDGTSQQVTFDALWQTNDTNIATVSNSMWTEGLVTTHAPGKVRIQATYGGVTGSTELNVSGLVIDQIQVTPFLEVIPQGYYLRYLATAIYNDGSTRDITGLCTWTTQDPMVADIYTSFWVKGIALGIGAGETFVQATYQGVTGRSRLTVTGATLAAIELDPPIADVEPGKTMEFEATGTFTDGSQREVTHYVTWSSSTTTIGDVSNAWISRGEATGFAPGSTTITARQGMVEGRATLNVAPAP